jgi:tetratricopeptide (TPR) repeat protein
MIPFVGREQEQARLMAAWEQARGETRVVLLAGEAGIGKTRLVSGLVERLREAGARILRGRGWDLDGSPAYWPWIDALGSYLDDAGPQAAASSIGDLDPGLGRLFPRLRRGPARPPDDEGSPAAERRLFGAVARLLEKLAAAGPLLLELDDLEKADPSSLRLLEHLAAAGAGPLLVVAAYRTPLPAACPAVPVVGRLIGRANVELLEPGPLDPAQIGLLLAAMTGGPPDAGTAAVLHARTGGNPLFASEFIRLLGPGQGSAVAQFWSAPLPAGVRGVIEQRLTALDPACRALLEIGAIGGREIDLEVLARVAGASVGEVLAALAPAHVAEVLLPVAGRPDHRAFSHPLLRECLHEGLPPLRRAELHRKLGDTLVARHAADLDDHLPVVASHYFAALPVGGAPLAFEYCRRAAARASALGARDEAARLLALALEALRLLDDDDGRLWCEVSLDLGDALDRTGRRDEARATFYQVAARAERLHLPRHLAMAALGLGGRFVWSRAQRDEREVLLLEQALLALDETEPALHARLLARLCAMQRDLRTLVSNIARCRDAVALARRAGDDTALLVGLIALSTLEVVGGSASGALVATDELQSLARTRGDLERVSQAHDLRIVLHLDLGQTDAAVRELAAGAEVNERLGQPSQRWFHRALQAEVALLRGDLARAEELTETARSMALAAQRPESAYIEFVQHYFIRRDQGRLSEVEQAVADAQVTLASYAGIRCFPAHRAAELGRPGETRAFLDRQVAMQFTELQDSFHFRFIQAMLAEMAARTGHQAAAAALEPLLAAGVRPFLTSPASVSCGSALRYRGLVAETLGRHEEAANLLREAVRENTAAEAVIWALRCEVDLLRVLAQTPAARAERAALLERVTVQARARGLEGLLVDARAAGADDGKEAPALRHAGAFWTIDYGPIRLRLPDGKGPRYLAELLAREGRPVPALELVAVASEGGAGDDDDPSPEPGAQATLVRRLAELEDELEQAERWNDLARAERARGEREEIAHELATAIGQGGPSDRAERARQSVTKALKGTIRRIAREHGELGRHFDTTVHTGLLCRYQPDPLRPWHWRVER